jgi:hypothetical protein
LGLIISAGSFGINTLADQGREATAWLTNGRPGEVVGYFSGRLLDLPILFVVIAFIRNLFVKPAASKQN